MRTKGTTGYALFAVLCACGHNIRKILAHHKALLALLFAAILGTLKPDNPGNPHLPHTTCD